MQRETLTAQRQTARGQLRREALVVAALSACREQSPGQLSLQDVADHAGVAKSVVLYHFGDRSTLLTALATRATRPLTEAHALLIEPDGDPREHLNRWLGALFDLVRDGARPWLVYLALLSEGNDQHRAPLRTCDHIGARNLADLLQRGHQQYCWHAPDAPRSATLVRALVDGMMLETARSEDPLAWTRLHALCRGAVLDLLIRR